MINVELKDFERVEQAPFFSNEGSMRAHDRRKGVEAVPSPAFACFFLARSKKNGPKKLPGACHAGYSKSDENIYFEYLHRNYLKY